MEFETIKVRAAHLSQSTEDSDVERLADLVKMLAERCAQSEKKLKQVVRKTR